MAERNFSDLVARATPSVPGCPSKTIENYVRDAAINICERTLAWRYQIPLFNLLPAVHEYAFEVPSNTEVQAIFAALVNSSPLRLMNLDDAICAYPAWADLFSGEDAAELWSETPSAALNEYTYNEETFDGISDFVLPDSVVADASTPKACTQLTPHRYIVLPLPDGATTYEMRMFVALKPRRDATSMDNDMFNELEDVILHRALNNLLILPNVPWSDRELAAYHAKQFTFLTGMARARANLGNNRASLTVRPQRFA